MLGIAILAALAYGFYRWKQNLEPGIWTPEKAALYRASMRFERNPQKLFALASYFDREGFPQKAGNLRARASFANQLVDTRYASANDARFLEAADLRNRIMRRALSSGNPVAIQEVAASFEGEGFGAAADTLRDYARGLEVMQRLPLHPPGAAFGIGTVIPSVYRPPPPPPPQPQVDADGNVITPVDVTGEGELEARIREARREDIVRDERGQPVNVEGRNVNDGNTAGVNMGGDGYYGHGVPAGG